MVTIQVRLFGGLRLGGIGRGWPVTGDGTFRVTLREGGTVREAIDGMRVPAAHVGAALLNGRCCAASTRLSSGDRVILVPQGMAALWPALGR